MRIIAGSCRGRVLHSPSWEGLRPTSDRLRETLFNIIRERVDGARVLDICAGTGAVGLEALSRGAAHVTFVEQDRRAVALIDANAAKCGMHGRYTVAQRDALQALRAGSLGLHAIVFVDPPYAAPTVSALLSAAAGHVEAGGVLVYEHSARTAAPATAGPLHRVRTLRQGDSALAFYEPPERAGASDESAGAV
jgi:16S rRNA (guanine966-N2)-methyltransferase